MAVVNKGLGNGFVINIEDSSKDQESYFCGARKNIKLKMAFFSASYNFKNDQAIIALTGANGIQLISKIYDAGGNFHYPVAVLTGNYIQQSNDFSDSSYYLISNLTGNDKVDTDPDGTSLASYLTESTDASAVNHFVSKTSVLARQRPFVHSVFAKKLNRNFIVLSNTHAGSERKSWFNIGNGTLGSIDSGAVVANISSSGDGWYRCSVQFSESDRAGLAAVYVAASNSFTTYQGDGSPSVALYQHQFEEDGLSSSKITSGSAVKKLHNEDSKYSFNFLTLQGTGTLDIFSPKLIGYVSGSTSAFASGEVKIFFGDSSVWSPHVDITSYGIFTKQTDGWHKFEYNFFSASKEQTPLFTLDYNSAKVILSSSTGKTYVFKDFGLHFDKPLTNDDVAAYRKIDNQNIEFENINRGTMPDVEI